MPDLQSALAQFTPADLEQIWSALREIYAASDMTTFPQVGLRTLNRLLPAHSSSYNEADLRTGSIRVFYEPDAIRETAEYYKPLFYRHKDEHPIMRLYEQGGGDDTVYKISDFISPDNLRHTELHRKVLSHMDTVDTLAFTLDSTAQLKVFFAINGREAFTERDRAVCLLLRPHLTQAFDNAIAFTRSSALALLATHTLQHTSDYGVILADHEGRIVHANDLATLHLAALYPSGPHETLPLALRSWIAHQCTRDVLMPSLPLEVTRDDDDTFLIRFAEAGPNHHILVTHHTQLHHLTSSLATALDITERQAEILLWLTRGKTNDGIAAIVGLSHRTVAKHLQHIFTRLGVENRRAAMLKALPYLPAGNN